MKHSITLAALAMCTFSVHGQEFSLLPSSEGEININHALVEQDVQTTNINNIVYQDYTKSFDVTLMNAGAPALPYFSESVILPGQGAVSLEVEHDGYVEYQNVLVTPSKGSLKRNINPDNVPYAFGAEYNNNAFYPGELARTGDVYILRNTRGITVSVQPYQYNPVTKVLRVYQNIRAKVLINDKEIGFNELEIVQEPNDVFMKVYQHHYLNANTELKYTPVEEEGEMLVIAADSYFSAIQPLVDWKNQSGVKTTLVGTSTAGSSDTQIKSYIQNFYSSNSNLVYVLLVGDHAQVPSHTYGSSGWEDLWSDSYYGQISGGNNDYYPELFIGRFSGNSSQIGTMVDRTLEYEKNPATGDWMTRAIGLASDEGAGYGDDNEADWQHARNNRTKLLNFGYTEVHEFYDGSQGGSDANGNPGPSDITPAVNEGIGLFNYTGHGDQTTCITGNYGSSDINAATSNGYYPYVISVACNNGTFTSGTCISETWLRATNAGTPTGAIAACGSSILMAWAEPMQTQDEMTDIIAESYSNNRKETLGGIFYNAQMSMLEDYNASSSAKEVMQTWVMFGDPSTIFRNKVTMNMNVTHSSIVAEGATSMDVSCDVEDARITVSQNNEYLGHGYVSNGTVTVNFPALTSMDDVLITGVRQNYLPYQGTVTVSGVGVEEVAHENISIYPNPATDLVQITSNVVGDKIINISDMSGKLVKTIQVFGQSNVVVPVEDLSKGLYMVNVLSNGIESTQKLIIE